MKKFEKKSKILKKNDKKMKKNVIFYKKNVIFCFFFEKKTYGTSIKILLSEKTSFFPAQIFIKKHTKKKM